MNVARLMETNGYLWSPVIFAMLIGLATVLIWLAFLPAQPAVLVRKRLDGYLERKGVLEDTEMRKLFAARVWLPLLRRILRILGRLTPQRNAESTRRLLLQAGSPGNLTVMDFFGLRLLIALLTGGSFWVLLAATLPISVALRNTLIVGALGYFIPLLWLRSRANGRRHQIKRALPDALDMLTIGVEAGLAFESALLKVGEKWHNALTQEFRRAVAEMRVGTPRDEALQRLAERCNVRELSTFVAVLIQSSQLGVSIAQVLHSQAAQMRIRRRQGAEEVARQASVKMVFPLVFLIFPALFVVILGPAVPTMLGFLNRFAGE